MDGKTAVITGASSGIGEATALALAGAGASVALAGRREDRISDLAARINLEGGKALPVKTDVTDEQQCRHLVEHAEAELGGVDVVVNNAGVMLLGPIAGADPEEWRRMVGANLMGVLYVTDAALRIMLRQGSGHFVNMSSVAGRFASIGAGVYNATKFAVNAFSEVLRQETHAAGVRVTVIEPGYVETELQQHTTNPLAREAMSKFHERVTQPLQAADIAESVLWAVTRPPHVAVAEVLVRPSEQR